MAFCRDLSVRLTSEPFREIPQQRSRTSVVFVSSRHVLCTLCFCSKPRFPPPFLPWVSCLTPLPSVPSVEDRVFPEAAKTQTRFILAQIRKLEVQHQGVSRARFPPKSPGENPPPFSPQPLVAPTCFLAVAESLLSRRHLYMAFPASSLSARSFFPELGLTLLQDDLISGV